MQAYLGSGIIHDLDKQKIEFYKDGKLILKYNFRTGLLMGESKINKKKYVSNRKTKKSSSRAD